MTEPSHEVEAAAATGAAAAVAAVQDQQQQQEQTEVAVDAAAMAAESADMATEASVDAVEASQQAVGVAEQAHEETVALGQATAVGLSDVYDRVGRIESKHDELAQEVRNAFQKLEQLVSPKHDDTVQKVEVTNATPPDTNAQDSQQAGSNPGSSSGTQQTGHRHRFGR